MAITSYIWPDGAELLVDTASRGQLDHETGVDLFQDDSDEVLKQKLWGPTERQRENLVSTLEKFADGVKHVADTFVEKVRPEELTLEVDFDLSAEVGWIVAKSRADATMKVTLTWKRADPTPEGATGGA